MSRSSKRRNREVRENSRAREVVTRSHARRTANEIERALGLIEDGSLQKAREVLEACERTHADSREALYLLREVYQEQSDFPGYLRACRRLLEFEPGNQSLNLALAGAYMCNAQPAAALLAFRSFVERWPYGKSADEARAEIARLEPLIDKILRDAPFPPDQRLQLAALHEEALGSIGAADYARTIELCEEILARSPSFIPAMNNLAHCYFECGRTDDAIAMSQRVVELEPDNVFAVANLARQHLLSGRFAEAEEWRIRLGSIRSQRDDVWAKKAETFSFFGDDKSVIQALEDARLAGSTRHNVPDVALLYHLAGVAYARQGKLAQAQRLWKDALKIHPGLKLAKDNLRDSEQPIAVRNGPWPYTIEYWVRREAIDELLSAIKGPCSRNDDEAIGQAVRRVVQKHPAILVAVPALLKRGDADGRSFAVRVAKQMQTPEMLEALRAFALSQHGPDALRIETANYLHQKEVLTEGAVRLWLNGEWRDIEVLGFEVTDETTDPEYTHPESADWAAMAFAALQREDVPTAQKLLKKCLAAEGDQPELLNNLAFSYRMQDRNAEYETLMRQIHERWPDYFFGQVGMADIATRDGDFDSAAELLAPLRRRRRLHSTEFTALMSASIQLFVAQDNLDAARSWLAIWKQARPDDLAIEGIEYMLNRTAAPHFMSKLFRNPFRRSAAY